MEKISEKGLDLTKSNIDKIKELFPECISEGKIDFNILEMLLGEDINLSNEKYSFCWVGKNSALKNSMKPSNSTLQPLISKSLKWNQTENVYIEGDNLEVLKTLTKTYYNKIKMIYIDPPYNTGSDFVYKDDFSDSIENYKKNTNQILKANPEVSGRYHTDWLNMICPRLRIAKDLLSDDGVIFISIDDNELHRMKLLCDEIFGEQNYRNELLVRRRIKSLNLQFADNGLKSFNVGYEYVLIYSKSDKFLFNPIRMKKSEKSEKGSWNVFWSNADRPTMRYELLGFTPKTGQWRWQKDMANEAVSNYEKYISDYSSKMSLEEYWIKTGKVLRFVRRIPDGIGKNGGVQYWVAPDDTSLRTSNWTDIEVSQIAKDYDLPFDNPKNVELIKTLISSVPGKDFIFLDFFAGSSTSADAVMRQNEVDGGKRKFILVQLPEMCDFSETTNACFKNICDIGEERIRLASKKIYNELKEKQLSAGMLDDVIDPDSLDLGFKVFKLESSNIKAWDPSEKLDEDTIFTQQETIKEGRSNLDVAYEIMLKYGVFNMPIEEVTINNKPIFNVGKGFLIIDLNDNITQEDVESIGKEKPHCVVFKESGFGTNDNVKLNAVKTLETFGVEDIKCL